MPMQLTIRRSAFTVIEVTISMAILAVSATALMVHLGNQNTTRGVMAATAQADTVMRTVLERVQSMPFEDLGTDWSAPSYYTRGQSLSEATLITKGLIPRATGLDNLRVHVEYYRAVTARDAAGNPDTTKLGIMDVTMDSPDDFRNELFVNPSRWDLGVKPAYYLGVGGQPDDWSVTSGIKAANVVGELDPVLIRVLVTWGRPASGTIPTRFLQAVTARRP